MDANKLMTNRDYRQDIIAIWAKREFGVSETLSLEQRGIRLVEEAIELAQACGCNPKTIHDLVDHIYSKPPGELTQEIGGVCVTTLALANAARASAELCEVYEVMRVLAKPAGHFTRRNAAKNALGFRADDGGARA